MLITKVAKRQQGVPLDMITIHPECSAPLDLSVAADVLLMRQEPDEGEDEEQDEGDGEHDYDDDDETDEGYSE